MQGHAGTGVRLQGQVPTALSSTGHLHSLARALPGSELLSLSWARELHEDDPCGSLSSQIF